MNDTGSSGFLVDTPRMCFACLDVAIRHALDCARGDENEAVEYLLGGDFF